MITGRGEISATIVRLASSRRSTAVVGDVQRRSVAQTTIGGTIEGAIPA